MKELQKLIIHNQVLLSVVLSKLGTTDEEIENLNSTIAELVNEKYEEYKERKNEKDRKESK